MRRSTRFMIVLTVLTAVSYGVLIWLGASHLFAGPDRLPPFDLRMTGYTHAEATGYLALLTPAQVALYAGTLRLIDTVFPILFGLWLGTILWRLTGDMHPSSRIMLLIAPGAYVMMDLAENALVAGLLHTGPAATPEAVALASSYTVSKFVTLVGAWLFILAFALRRRRIRAA